MNRTTPHTPKRIALLGSTGSIGTQTLQVVDEHPDIFKVTVLIAGSRVDTLIQQALRYRPALAVIADESKYWKLKSELEPHGIRTAAGTGAICDAMESDLFDTVVTATVGYSGLAPTLRAIRAGKEIALANKETLVVAGDIVTAAARQNNVRILPVDSEHSAIYQCLAGEDPQTVRRLILTASGGPFRTFTAERITTVRAADALKHPNWSMGAKITVDSATMVNKAFEIIEARWLFGMESERIQAIVHPQSVVHSMVEYCDGSVKAQMGAPDMRGPIRYALGAPGRLQSATRGFDATLFSGLTFEPADTERFPGITLGHLALDNKGNTACIINAANEVAVAAFLGDRITFGDIYQTIIRTLDTVQHLKHPSYDDYVATHHEATAVAKELIKQQWNQYS